ncbi:hypothetical protein [Mesorhizobium xinjiangense]|uniref:hypothetical protein n=1 Tax=Mesorhizobium xinjiangense TaxID=2678685 RepID=UPI0012EE7B30|nr:hypothetical protein [Mesorhizobium xinjiangense]
MSPSTQRSCFLARLRRDRALFALVGMIVMLAGLLQPFAEARAAGSDNAWVICTTFGVVKADPAGDAEPLAGAADDCPLCIAGHHCGSVPLRTAVPAAGIAWEPLLLPAFLSWRRRSAPVLHAPLGAPPPAIRAPPVQL